MHYFRNTSTLKDGDLVLMDFAPDYRYYVSDIGRVWPVNGKYTPVAARAAAVRARVPQGGAVAHPARRDRRADS